MSDEYKKLGEQVIREMPLKSLLGRCRESRWNS